MDHATIDDCYGCVPTWSPPERNRPGRLGRPGRRDGGGCPHRGPAGPPAPAPPRPLRRSRARRASPRRSPAGSGQSGLGRPRGLRRRSAGPRPDGPDPDGPDPDGPDPDPRTPVPTAPTTPPQRSQRSRGQPDSQANPSSQPSSQVTETRSPPVSPAAPFRARLLTVPGVGEGAPGRRSAARGPFGRTVGARVPQDRPFALHLPATVRAAVVRAPRAADAPAAPAPASHTPHTMIVASSGQIAPKTGHDHGSAQPTPARRVRLVSADLRQAVREGREGNLLLAVDASGSMAARQRMRAVKGAVLSLLLDAYQRRDKVGLVTFRGAELSSPFRPPPRSKLPPAAYEPGHRRPGPRSRQGWPRRACWRPNACGIPPPRPAVWVTDGLGHQRQRRRPGQGRGRAGRGGQRGGGSARCSTDGCALAERLAVQLGAAPAFGLDELEAGPGLAAVARQMTLAGRVA